MSPSAPAAKRAKSPAKAPAKKAKAAPRPAAPPAEAPAATPDRMPPTTWAPASAPASAPAATPAAVPATPPRMRGGYAPGPDMSTGAADFWRSVYEVARKEVLQHIRTKRLLIIGGLIILALTLVTLVFGPRIASNLDDFGFFEDAPAAAENLVLVVFLGFLGLVFIQLLPIVLTADAVCSEWSSRTIFLMLSKPVSRTAFVLGKFLGSVVTVLATLVILLGLDYLVMQPLYPGSPDASDVLGFVKFVAFICAGCTALAALALFFSTVTRSTAISILVTLGVWLVGFNILEHTGELINAGRENPDEDLSQFFRYLNPGYDMGLGIGFLVSDDGSNEFMGAPPDEDLPSPAIALLALAGHVAVWFGSALLVVQRRNFE